MLFDSLERRALLSATLTNGVLTITGTTGDDVIGVSLDRSGKLVVNEAIRPTKPSPTVTTGTRSTKLAKPAKPAKPVITTTKFVLANVTSIVIDAGEGNDQVVVGPTAKKGATPLNTTINGGSGNDALCGGNGNDLINGGDGNDEIAGGPGADTLNGEAGNDFIDARDKTGIDTVDGGTNDPVAGKNKGDIVAADVVDLVTNIETTLPKNKKLPMPSIV